MRLFEGFGVEIEYAIVDRDSLDVRPIADRLMEAVAGEPASEVERGEIAWSNELVLHVLELKTNGPATRLGPPLAEAFARDVREANEALAGFGAILLPGGSHPWMDPGTETRLWPHEYTEVYRTFDRIFSCRGHGWANLQSTHLNLPFQGDHEFRALHSAIRAVLPILPALAASSPILDGRATGALDRRMIEYRENARRVPSVSGRVVPAAVESGVEYEAEILEPIYRDLAPLDPEGILRHEWVNARGAIARFDRGAIEIRVLDTQECPSADLAVVGAVVRAVRGVCERILDGDDRAHRLDTDRLADLLDRVVVEGERTRLEEWERGEYLEALGLAGGAGGRGGSSVPGTAGELWDALLEGTAAPDANADRVPDRDGRDPLATILAEGPLARRILRALGRDGSLLEVYRELAACLAENRVFAPGGR